MIKYITNLHNVIDIFLYLFIEVTIGATIMFEKVIVYKKVKGGLICKIVPLSVN